MRLRRDCHGRLPCDGHAIATCDCHMRLPYAIAICDCHMIAMRLQDAIAMRLRLQPRTLPRAAPHCPALPRVAPRCPAQPFEHFRKEAVKSQLAKKAKESRREVIRVSWVAYDTAEPPRRDAPK
eukprot:3311383-Prymnesium_polylepis.1